MDGSFASAGTFDSSGGQLIGIHGIASAVGGAGTVRIDLSVFVAPEPIFGALECKVLGLLTPTS